MEIASTTTPFAVNFWYAASMSGASATHAAHQLAPKVSHTGCPFSELRDTSLPSTVVPVKSCGDCRSLAPLHQRVPTARRQWCPTRLPSGTTAVELSGPGGGAAPKIGSPAQDFTGTTVDGKEVSLSSLKGHPVWLTFGASWCAACVAE